MTIEDIISYCKNGQHKSWDKKAYRCWHNLRSHLTPHSIKSKEIEDFFITMEQHYKGGRQ